jgi:hypothetical protein
LFFRKATDYGYKNLHEDQAMIFQDKKILFDKEEGGEMRPSFYVKKKYF